MMEMAKLHCSGPEMIRCFPVAHRLSTRCTKSRLKFTGMDNDCKGLVVFNSCRLVGAISVTQTPAEHKVRPHVRP